MSKHTYIPGINGLNMDIFIAGLIRSDAIRSTDTWYLHLFLPNMVCRPIPGNITIISHTQELSSEFHTTSTSTTNYSHSVFDIIDSSSY